MRIGRYPIILIVSLSFLLSCTSTKTAITENDAISIVQNAVEAVNAKTKEDFSLKEMHYYRSQDKLFLQSNDETDYRTFVFSLTADTPTFLYEERTYLPREEQFLEYNGLELFSFNFNDTPASNIDITIYPNYPTDEMAESDVIKWEYPKIKETDIFAFKYRTKEDVPHDYILVEKEQLSIIPDVRSYGEIVINALVNDQNSCFDFEDSDIVQFDFIDGVIYIAPLCGETNQYDPLLYVNLIRFPDVEDVVFRSDVAGDSKSDEVVILTVEDVQLTEEIKDLFLVEACMNWTLSNDDVERIFRLSSEISSIERTANYYYIPCEIGGTMKKDSSTFSYQVNAGATMELISVDNTYSYYGCSGEACTQYFLMVPDELSTHKEVTANTMDKPSVDGDYSQSVFDSKAVEKIMIGIDTNLTYYATKRKDFPSPPSEGGAIIAYYNGQVLTKIEVHYYGADRQAFIEYYLNNEELISKRETVSYYDLDALINAGEYIIERDEVYLYYFVAGRLQQMINPQGVILSADATVESEQLKDFSRILEEVKEMT